MTIEQVRNRQVGAFDQTNEQALRYLGLNPNSPADQAMVAVARHYDLDPLLKHVVVIPKGGIYITRDGLLDVAHRSGQLDGIVVDQEPTLDQNNREWVARVSVYRKDMRHPFTFPGRYPVSGSNKAYAQEMALKAAESHALRRAFRVTGIPAYDEHRPEAAPQASGLAAAQQAHQTTEPEETLEETSVAEGEDGFDSRERPSGSVPVEGEIVTYAEDEPLDVQSNLARRLFASMGDAGISKDQAHEFMTETLGREISTSRDLTVGEARRLLQHLPSQEDQ